MVSQFTFAELVVEEITILPSGDAVVYASFPNFCTFYRFIICSTGGVFGETHGNWLRLTQESADEVKQVFNEQFSKVPVYFAGGYRRAG